MIVAAKDYRVHFDFRGEPEHADMMRTLIRACLESAGIEMTGGTVTAERWLVEETAKLRVPKNMPRSRGVDSWMPIGRTKRR